MAATITPEKMAALGLPALNESDVPACGIFGATAPCTREGK